MERKLATILSADVKGYSRLMGEDEEAISAFERALTDDPHFSGAHLALAVLYKEGGREEEARAATSEFRRHHPTVSLEVLKQVIPYKGPAEVERVLTALRKGGLK